MVLAASKEKMMANVAMLEYYCHQICVKHEGNALLNVTVEYNGEEQFLDNYANVFLPEEHEDDLDKMFIVPKSNLYLSAIIDGLYKSHPEFKQEVFSQGDKSESADNSKVEHMGDGFAVREDKDEIEGRSSEQMQNDQKIYFIRLTMPPVTNSLRKTYHEIVENFYKGTKMKLDSERVKMKANVTPQTIGYTDKELKEVDAKMEEIYNDALIQAQNIRKDKDEEIEWGYNRFVERYGDDYEEEEYEESTSPMDSTPSQSAPHQSTTFGQSSEEDNNYSTSQSIKL